MKPQASSTSTINDVRSRLKNAPVPHRVIANSESVHCSNIGPRRATRNRSLLMDNGSVLVFFLTFGCILFFICECQGKKSFCMVIVLAILITCVECRYRKGTNTCLARWTGERWKGSPTDESSSWFVQHASGYSWGLPWPDCFRAYVRESVYPAWIVSHFPHNNPLNCSAVAPFSELYQVPFHWGSFYVKPLTKRGPSRRSAKLLWLKMLLWTNGYHSPWFTITLLTKTVICQYFTVSVKYWHLRVKKEILECNEVMDGRNICEGA